MTDLLFHNGTLQVWPVATLAIAAFIAGFATGGWPGGASLCAPVLTLALPFERAQSCVLPMLVFSQLFALVIHWNDIRWRLLWSVVGSAVVGISIGWLIWQVFLDCGHFSIIRRLLKSGVAVLTLLLAANIFLTRVRETPLPPQRMGATAGRLLCVAAGFLSTIANVAGPLLVWYMYTRNATKEQITATVAVSFLFINGLKFIPYTALGFYTWNGFHHLFASTISYSPIFVVVIFGVAIGRWRLVNTTDKRFDVAIVVGMVIVAGGILLQVAHGLWGMQQ